MSKKTIILILVILDVVLLVVVAVLLITGRHSDVAVREAEGETPITYGNTEDESNDCEIEDGIERMDPHELRRIMYEDYPMPKKCPKCKGKVLPIQYGLLIDNFFKDSLDYDLEGRRRVIPAGCVVEDEKWMCEECKSRFVSMN